MIALAALPGFLLVLPWTLYWIVKAIVKGERDE